jgi:small-conductance mechanosensitive channel
MLDLIRAWWLDSLRPWADRYLTGREILGISVERWLLACLALLIAFVVLRLAKRVLRNRVHRIAERFDSNWARGLVGILDALRWWFLLGGAIWIASLALDLEPENQGLVVLRSVVSILVILQAAIAGVRFVAFAAERYGQEHFADDPAGRTMLGAVAFIGRLALWSIAFLLILENAGVEVTALVAGLGIGGAAIALASQNILSDLFASLSIVLDRPFVLGDFIKVGDDLGSVEHIGLKTTRLRSLSGEQLIFPNNDLLQSRIRNFKRMEERRVVFSIGVIYETPMEKVEAIPGFIRSAIESQEATRFDRAHFHKYGDSALIFEAVYYVLTPDFNRYMDIHQAINLLLLRRFAEANIEFAYPTQTLFLARRDSSSAA